MKCLYAAIALSLQLAAWSAAIADPLYDAANAALAHDQAAEAADLIKRHPGVAAPGRERLLLARALLALGAAEAALDAIALPDASLPAVALAKAGWPASLRGPALQIGAEALIARDGASRQAARWLESALAERDVAYDRCLLLLAEQSSDNRDRAQRCLERLWSGFPRSDYRGQAGLALAALIADDEPVRAREILAGVRAMERIPNATRRTAAELLCRLLIAERPGQCLVVAEQDAKRCADGAGLLPLYHALALARLSPQEGLAELRQLPDELRQMDAARSAIERLDQSAPQEVRLDAGQRLELAEAAAALQRWPEVAALLEPIARDDAEALVLLAHAPVFNTDSYLDSPAARQPIAAIALAQNLIQSNQQRRAWLLLQPMVASTDRAGATGIVLARLLYWAGEAALSIDVDERQRLRRALLALDENCLEVGLAWCDEAQRLEAQKNDAHDAWTRAARALPAEHPWQAAAAWRAARWNYAQEQYREAEAILLDPAGSGDGADHLRCRFLLANTLARLGKWNETKQLAESLREHADADQLIKLDRLIREVEENVH